MATAGQPHEGVLENIQAAVEQLVCDDQRREDSQHVPVAARRDDQHAALPAVVDDPAHQLGGAQGNYAEAAPLLQRSLAIREKALGPEHPDVATSLNNLAGLYQAQGNYAEAAPLFQRSLAIWEKALGPEHPDVALSLNNLAELYRAQGNYAEAAPLLQRSLAIWEKTLVTAIEYAGPA